MLWVGGGRRGAFKSNNHPWGIPALLVHTPPRLYIAPSYCASLHAALFTHPLIFTRETGPKSRRKQDTNEDKEEKEIVCDSTMGKLKIRRKWLVGLPGATVATGRKCLQSKGCSMCLHAFNNRTVQLSRHFRTSLLTHFCRFCHSFKFSILSDIYIYPI